MDCTASGCSGERIGRRSLLLGCLQAVSLPAAESVAEANPETVAAPAADDLLVRIAGDGSHRVVTPSDLRMGAPPILVWPMEPRVRVIRNGTRFNQILLLRLTSDGPLAGVAAFSAICTHAACRVSEWNAAALQFICPCHASVYAAQHDGAVVRGPAARPLPVLPVKIVDGALRVASGFVGRVGGDTSRTM